MPLTRQGDSDLKSGPHWTQGSDVLEPYTPAVSPAPPHKPHHKHRSMSDVSGATQRLSEQSVSETEGRMLTSACVCQAWMFMRRMQATGVRQDPHSENQRKESEHQGIAAYEEEWGARAGRKGSL